MKVAPICLSYHSESNDMQRDVFWPDPISDLWPNFDLDLLRSTLVSFDSSWREEHNFGLIVALGPIVQKLLQKNICAKNWWLATVNVDLWSLNNWPEVKSEAAIQIGCFIAHLLLFVARLCLYQFEFQSGSTGALHFWPESANILQWWRHLTLKILT